MKYIKTGKFRVIAIAAGILVVSLAVLITSVHVALGAEESRIIEEPAAVAALAAEKPVQAGDSMIDAQPEPGHITEQQALESCLSVAIDVFGLDVDGGSLTATFRGEEDIIDENGNIVYTAYAVWTVEGPDLHCTIDAASGAPIIFYDNSDSYPGGSITQGGFFNEDRSAPDGGPVYLHNCPDNMYIKAAEKLVTERLANGRAISDIMIDGVQFVWNDNSEGFDPGATGTIQVDCHVYMETGMNYTLSFWGTDDVVLKVFSTHPTDHACKWGYFYEKDGANYPPETEQS